MPALLDPGVRARFVAHYHLQDKHPQVLFDAVDKGTLAPRGKRDPRLNDTAVRTRPWNLKKQLWTDAVAAEYRRTIESFAQGSQTP